MLRCLTVIYSNCCTWSKSFVVIKGQINSQLFAIITYTEAKDANKHPEMPKKVSRIDTQPNKNITKVPLKKGTISTWNYIFQPFIFRRLLDFRLSTSCCCFSLAAPLRVNLLVPSFWCGCDRPASSANPKMCPCLEFLGSHRTKAWGGKETTSPKKKKHIILHHIQQFNSTTTFQIWNIQNIQWIFRHTNPSKLRFPTR